MLKIYNLCYVHYFQYWQSILEYSLGRGVLILFKSLNNWVISNLNKYRKDTYVSDLMLVEISFI